jgi:hypothetical protein
MRIECLTTFLDGRDRFEAGDLRTIDDERAAVFIGHGWAKSLDGVAVPQQSGDVTLDVHDGVHASEVTHG